MQVFLLFNKKKKKLQCPAVLGHYRSLVINEYPIAKDGEGKLERTERLNTLRVLDLLTVTTMSQYFIREKAIVSGADSDNNNAALHARLGFIKVSLD